jgi:hypothetical protein
MERLFRWGIGIVVVLVIGPTVLLTMLRSGCQQLVSPNPTPLLEPTPSTTRTAAPSLSPKPTLAADYVAERDGYSFENSSDTTTGDDWEVWKLVFGDSDASRAQWKVQAAADEDHDGVFAGGLCYGCAASNLSIFGGWNKPSDLDQEPKAQNAYSIDAGQFGDDFGTATPVVRDFVERYYLEQLTEAGEKAEVWGAKKSYEIIRAALKAGDRKVPVLRIHTESEHYGKPAGHAVVPVGIVGPDKNGKATIRIWDDNWAGQIRTVEIDTKKWAWRYDFLPPRNGKAAQTWTSEHGKMGVVRIADIVGVLEETPGGSGLKADSGDNAEAGPPAPAHLTVVSNADARFWRPSGGSLGFVRGRLVDDLSGARFVYPDPRGQKSSVQRYLVPATGSIQRSVTAASKRPFTYAVITPQGNAIISGRPGAGRTERIAIGDEARTVAVTPRAKDAACTITLSRFVGDRVYVLAAAPNKLGAKDTFAVEAVSAGTALRVANGGRARTYTVDLSVFGDEQHYVSDPITIRAGETQTVKAYDWENLDTSQVGLVRDTNSDGAADTRVVLRIGTTGGRTFPWFVVWIAGGVLVVTGLIAGGFVWYRHTSQ